MNKTENFIKKARKVHGDKYDYSKVVYVKAIEKVIIICPEHGEFLQSPNKHLCGRGCKFCSYDRTSKRKIGNGNLFIKKGNKKYENRYDYSKVEYVNCSTEVIIGCPIHGKFLTLPTYHLKSTGCPKCGRNLLRKKRVITEEYIERAKVVHGDRYDYSKVEYTGSENNISIICSVHGEFQQAPYNHLQGKGCSKCSKRYMDTEYFIEQSNIIHNNKYDYSKTIYTGSKNSLIIICPEHRDFLQSPNKHLSGRSCNKCSGKGFDFLSLTQAKKHIRKLNLKSQKEYNNWWKSNETYARKLGLPLSPHKKYKHLNE